MEKPLSGRVALVTGAGSGIGKAAALVLAARGAKVGLVSRDMDELEGVRKEIEEKGSESLAIAADIADQQKMKNAVEEVVNQYGRLDTVFANAGINGVWAAIDNLKLEEWEQTLQVNLTGTFITIQECIPHLKKHGGSITITSSVNGTRMFSNSGATAYSVTKAGQVAMAKMLALELAQFKIRVNVICPGWIETDIDKNTTKRKLDDVGEPVQYPEGSVPLTDGGPGDPVQVAELVCFLASEAASHITGTEIFIDGGQSLLEG